MRHYNFQFPKSAIGPLIGIMAITCLILVGCSVGSASGNSDKNGDNDIDTGFPHVEGANQIDAAEIDAEQLGFASDDGVATLNIAEGKAMSVASYYHMDIRDSGWTMVDGRASQYIQMVTLTKGMRLAFLTLVPGVVLQQFPDAVEPIDFGPFNGEIPGIGTDEVLLYTQIGTCEEDTIDDCILAVQQKKINEVIPPMGQ